MTSVHASAVRVKGVERTRTVLLELQPAFLLALREDGNEGSGSLPPWFRLPSGSKRDMIMTLHSSFSCLILSPCRALSCLALAAHPTRSPGLADPGEDSLGQRKGRGLEVANMGL